MLAALALLAGVRIVQAIRAETLTPDGIIYVEMAQRWGDDSATVIEKYDYHVAYPVALSHTHSLMNALGLADAPDAWDRAGQVISILAAVGAMVGVWCWCRLLVGPRAAILSMVLFGLGKKWVMIGSDVQSDAMSACFQIWGIVATYQMLTHLARRRKQALLWAVMGGVLIGLGYLVRPESLLILAAALPLGLLVWWRRHPKAWLAVSSLVTITAMAILTSLPYMLAIGGLTKKKNLGEMIRQLFADAPAPPAILATTALTPLWQLMCAIACFISKTVEAIHPVPAGLALAWLIGWGLFRRKSFWTYPTPTRLGGAFIVLLSAGLFVITSLLLKGQEPVSHRHTLIAVLALTPLIGAGVFAFTGLLHRGVAAAKLPTLSPQATFWVFAIALPVLMAAHSLAEPPHVGKGAYRLAGHDVARQCLDSPPTGPIIADEAWIGHYVRQLTPTMRHIRPGDLSGLTAAQLQMLADRRRASYIIFRGPTRPTEAMPAIDGFTLWPAYPSGSKSLYVYQRTGGAP